MKAVINEKINQVMKNYTKYICAIILLLGTSVSAWGAIFIEYDGNKYYNGNTITINVDLDDDIVASSDGMTIKNDGDGWSSSTWYYGYIYATISGTYVYSNLAFGMAGVEGKNGTPYWVDEDHYTSFYEWNNWQYETLSFYTSYAFDAAGTYNSTITIVQKDDNDASTLQSATITVSYVVTKVCATPTVAFESETVYKDKDASSFTKTATAKVGNTSTGQTITYTSSDTDVATVNSSTGAVTLKGVVGSTVITATAAEEVGEYCEATGSYTLYVYTNPTVNNTNFAGVSRTPTSLTVKGCQVSDKGGLPIINYGWVIGTATSVDWSTKTTYAGHSGDVSLDTDFGSATTVGDLTPGTTYYIRAFAYNGKAFGYAPYGNFTTPYLITLNKNEGDENGSAYVLPNGTSLTNISAPTKTGYEVEGYYTTSDFGAKVATFAGALQASITVSATTWTDEDSKWKRGAAETFYAKWTAKEYTVTLDQNGGSGGSSSVTATYNSAMPSATMPTTPPTGKTFDGYYYNSVKYYNADGSSAHVWDVAGTATLVASWTTATPTLEIASVDKIVISSTSPSLAEGASTTVSYNTTVTLSHGDPESGYYWLGWNVYETGNESNTLTVTNNQFTMPDHDVTVSANLYTGLVFSCAELTLTPKLVTASTPIFITSTASKTVRSQDSILIVGSGLTPSQTLEFPDLPSKFAIKGRTNSALAVAADGTINAVAYIYYTPDAGDTSDGLDKLTGISVKVGGTKPRQVNLTQDIIGRHLPSQFVIAAKRNNKWYALPDTMTVTGTPKPIEIAVDDIDNPSLAYTTADAKYSLEGPAASNISGGVGQYVKLVMNSLWSDDSDLSKGHAPLFGTTTGTAKIGKSGNAQATNPLGKGYWWQLIQKNTSITNPQDAKYQIYCANNDTTLSLKENAGNPIWGLYKSGIDELRLIPASNIVPTEAYFVEWAQHGGVIEVDAQGVAATSVVAHLGEATSSAITLVQTKAGDAKNKSSKYNYTVNFGDGIDFAAAASNGAMLTLEWKNGETVKAMSNIVVPKVIATSATMSSINSGDLEWLQWEVHVLPGVTLTANAGDFTSNDVTIKHLEIYPGATVVVTKGDAESGILTATNLVLRNGWSRAGTKTYDVARLFVTPSTATLKATNVYADWYIDYDQYYPVAVPWNATVANFEYRYSSVEPTVGYDKNIRLRYYDGASRATNIQEGVGSSANWKAYGEGSNLPVPATLTPSAGYVMTAKRPSGKAFSIIRMPLTLPSGTWGAGSWTTNGEAGNVSETHKDQITVTAYGVVEDSETAYAEGWNLIANPYMAIHQGAISYTDGKTYVTYVNIPDVDFKEYSQLPTVTTKLAPASAFLIQAPKNGTITFGTANRKPSAPSYRVEETPESVPEQQAYIMLSSDEANDMMGILVSDKYTEAYEINADLEKILSDGNTLRTYMYYGDRNMAYVAINETLAREWIPVSVRIPNDGEYTFSLHEASIAGELEGVYLIDYDSGDLITNLLDQSYTFYSSKGTFDYRFAINAKVGKRDVPTDIDVTDAEKNSGKAVKFLYRDKLYILRNNRIYDATGKQVKGGAQ